MRGRVTLWSPRWAAIALVAGLLLVGCSEPDEPGTITRTTPTPATSSPSPTPTTPEAQVEAAVRTYYAELTKAAQSQQTSRLKTLVDKNCPCYGSARTIDETAAEDRTTPEASWTVRQVRVHDVVGKTAAAEVEYDVSAHDVLNAAGDSVQTIPARSRHLDLSFVFHDDGWILTNVFNLAG